MDYAGGGGDQGGCEGGEDGGIRVCRVRRGDRDVYHTVWGDREAFG